MTVFISVMISPLVLAADWKFTPSVSLQESWIDNVTLSDDSTTTESEWVTQLNPGVSLAGKGRELDLSFTYSMQNLFYSRDSGRNNINHQLNSRLTANLVPRWFFLDASVTISQQLVSPDGKTSTNNLAITGNREDVTTASISPYITFRMSKQILAHVQITHSRVMYEKNKTSNSSTNQYEMQFSSAGTDSPWSWSCQFSSQESDYGDDTTFTTETNDTRKNVALNLGYELSAKIKVNSQFGYEVNEYQKSVSVEQPNDSHWQISTTWIPNLRTILTAGAGERFYGKTLNLEFQRKGRRSAIKIAYNESLTSERQLLLDQYSDEQGIDNEVPAQTPGALDSAQALPDAPGLPNDVFIDRQATLSWSYNTRKTTSRLTTSRSDREYRSSAADEVIDAISFAWGWQLTRKNNLTTILSQQKSNSEANIDTFNSLSFGLYRQLGKQANSAIEVRHNQRDSDVAGNDYTENQLTARLDVRW